MTTTKIEGDTPVVDRPTAETHFTCAAAPSPGMTHHMMPPKNECRYCGAGAGVLRERYGL